MLHLWKERSFCQRVQKQKLYKINDIKNITGEDQYQVRSQGKSTKSIESIKVIAVTESEAEHQKKRNVRLRDYNLEKKHRSRDRDEKKKKKDKKRRRDSSED